MTLNKGMIKTMVNISLSFINMLRVSALDCGEEAAHWMSTFLERNCRLIEHHKQDNRTCKLGGIVLFIKIPFLA